jgi:hypothetical protein
MQFRNKIEFVLSGCQKPNFSLEFFPKIELFPKKLNFSPKTEFLLKNRNLSQKIFGKNWICSQKFFGKNWICSQRNKFFLPKNQIFREKIRFLGNNSIFLEKFNFLVPLSKPFMPSCMNFQ